MCEKMVCRVLYYTKILERKTQLDLVRATAEAWRAQAACNKINLFTCILNNIMKTKDTFHTYFYQENKKTLQLIIICI